MRHKAHASFIIAALILLISLGVVQAQEPQFKMWIAFEDDSAQKDTVWVVIDEDATEGFQDANFGEDLKPFDSLDFQVYFLLNDSIDSIYNSIAFPIRLSKSYSIKIYGINGVPPIRVEWDTNLIAQSELPEPIQQAYIDNSYLFFKGFNDGYEIFRSEHSKDSTHIVLPVYEQGGGPDSHFPIDLVLSSEPRYIGILKERNIDDVILFPNPAHDRISFSQSVKSLRVYNTAGVLVHEHSQPNMNDLDISGLTPGVYILQITDRTGSYNQRLIKQ